MMLQCPQPNQSPYQSKGVFGKCSMSFTPPPTTKLDSIVQNPMVVLSSSHNRVHLEPTPIAPSRMNIVAKVGFEDTLLLEQGSYNDYLRPLLGQQGLKSLTKLGRHTSLILKTAEQFSSSESLCDDTRLRESHKEKWSLRFKNLIQFREEYGHCLVPLEWPENPSLAHWVKHQRCQFKAKLEGKHSTLTNERQSALEEMGFVWDSHKATWEERLNGITSFCERHGHCNAPSKFPKNPQLSIWVKCQRRQSKLFLKGKKSNITHQRISKLSSVGFVWTPRQRKESLAKSPNLGIYESLLLEES